VERPAVLEDDKEYQLVNAKRNRGGIVPRERLTGREIKTKGQYFVRAGDFLIANRQIIHGACGIVPPELDGALVSGEYTVLLPKNGLHLPWFSYFTHTAYFQLTCFHSSIGVDVEKMVFKLEWWLKHELNVPPLGEQEKTAEILSIWDTALDQIRALVTAAKRRKKALMQKLLTGKKRLPGFSGRWRVARIGDRARCFSGGTPLSSRPDFYLGDIPWIKSGELNKRDIWTTGDHITTEAVSSSSAKYIEPNTLLLALYGATAGIPAFARIRATINQAVLALVPTSSVETYFLYYWLTANRQRIIATYCQGGQPNLTAGIVQEIEFPEPTPAEQRAIAAVLTTADEEIKSLEAKCTALERQKKGLMQKLLTGEVRVKG